MPRPKRPGGPEPKKRSRNGCWPCKSRKVKCGEEKPACINCQRQGETCDYSIRLNWDGRSKKKSDNGAPGSQVLSFNTSVALSSNLPIQGPSRVAPEQASTVSNTEDDGRRYVKTEEGPQRPLAQILPPVPQFASDLTNSQDANPSMQAGLELPRLLPPWPDHVNNGNPPLPTAPSFSILPQLPQFQVPAYPSPSESQETSASANSPMPYQSMRLPHRQPTSTPAMMTLAEVAVSPSNVAKRVRLSPLGENFRSPTGNSLMRQPPYGVGDLDDTSRPTFQPLTPTYLSQHFNDPLTPAGSSTTSDDYRSRWLSKATPASSITDGEVRRVSVNSLLSNSPEPEDMPPPTDTRQQAMVTRQSPVLTMGHHRQKLSHSETYGLDRGLPDLDLPRNDDTNAISAVTPSDPGIDFDPWLGDFDAVPEFAFGLQRRGTVFEAGGYYAQPVPIKIPRSLEPLPATLLQNPMNMLYFHHFLNHTARILVPHDCSQNPFKTILPKMAVENSTLLNLLLAYSASHRARLLSHKEPGNRIALWVRDVFPSLRHTLDDLSKSNTQISNANLATAIMLSSLEIISPSTFGISIPWQNHLNVARQIIHARYTAPQSISRNDSVAYFLSRWFAYLDVLGSLSGRTNDLPLFSGDYWAHSSAVEDNVYDSDEDYVIDCLLGMTPRCIYLLAQIASLARQCDNERISSDTGLANLDWQPSPSVRARAKTLLDDLDDARTHMNRPCPHRHGSVDSTSSEPSSPGPSNPATQHSTSSKGWDNLELLASNDSFHLAASIHLHRRILFLPRSHPTVQTLVHAIVSNLSKIRRGGTAEACLLFPMFTAGCEALEEDVRELIYERSKAMESVGMMQVTGARKLMERVWEESRRGRSDGDNEVLESAAEISAGGDRRGERGWEELLAGGEFFG